MGRVGLLDEREEVFKRDIPFERVGRGEDMEPSRI